MSMSTMNLYIHRALSKGHTSAKAELLLNFITINNNNYYLYVSATAREAGAAAERAAELIFWFGGVCLPANCSGVAWSTQ